MIDKAISPDGGSKRTTSAPAPISPVRGYSLPMATLPIPRANWELWARMPMVTLREAALLSLDLEPNPPEKKYNGRLYRYTEPGSEFDNRLKLAIAHVRAGLLKQSGCKQYYVTESVEVSLPDFAAFAQSNGLSLPESFPRGVSPDAAPVMTATMPVDMEGVLVTQSETSTWKLKPNIGRVQGYRLPLYQFLKKAEDDGAKTCPKAWDVIIYWKHNAPDGIEVIGDIIHYENKHGKDKPAGVRAIQAAIDNLLLK